MVLSKKKKLIIGGMVTFTVLTLIFLYRDAIKKIAKETLSGNKWFDETLSWYRDLKTKNIVNNLHPKYKDIIKEFFSRVEKELGLQIIATSGYRTFEQQERLYRENNQNAKAGFSSHNYGFAIDINVLKNGKTFLRKASSNDAWNNSGVVKIASDMGLKWGGGGNFGSYHDPVHFYIEPNNLKTKDMYALKTGGKVDEDGYVIV